MGVRWIRSGAPYLSLSGRLHNARYTPDSRTQQIPGSPLERIAPSCRRVANAGVIYERARNEVAGSAMGGVAWNRRTGAMDCLVV